MFLVAVGKRLNFHLPVNDSLRREPDFKSLFKNLYRYYFTYCFFFVMRKIPTGPPFWRASYDFQNKSVTHNFAIKAVKEMIFISLQVPLKVRYWCFQESWLHFLPQLLRWTYRIEFWELETEIEVWYTFDVAILVPKKGQKYVQPKGSSGHHTCGTQNRKFDQFSHFWVRVPFGCKHFENF